MSTGARCEENGKNLHGTFTGRVKAVLYVKDVQKSAAFFRDVLGFEFLNFAFIDDSPYYAEMAAGSTKFGLHEPTNEADVRRVGRHTNRVTCR